MDELKQQAIRKVDRWLRRELPRSIHTILAEAIVWAILLSIVIPSVVSLALTYGVHSLRGTPMPLESTVPTAIFVIPSTLVWGYISRKRARKQEPGEQT